MAEWLTRATIWIAMIAWTWGILAWRKEPGGGFTACVPWLIGGIFYGIHILFAYEAFYEWSHATAWEKTALDTAAETRFETGIGLLLNYLFGAWLAVDLCLRWTEKAARSRIVTEGLVFFFLVNGAIIFGEGPVVFLGTILSFAILWKWIRQRMGANRRKSTTG